MGGGWRPESGVLLHDEGVLDDASGGYTCTQDVLLSGHVRVLADALKVVKVATTTSRRLKASSL
jgi:hypothetical protein